MFTTTFHLLRVLATVFPKNPVIVFLFFLIVLILVVVEALLFGVHQAYLLITTYPLHTLLTLFILAAIAVAVYCFVIFRHMLNPPQFIAETTPNHTTDLMNSSSVDASHSKEYLSTIFQPLNRQLLLFIKTLEETEKTHPEVYETISDILEDQNLMGTISLAPVAYPRTLTTTKNNKTFHEQQFYSADALTDYRRLNNNGTMSPCTRRKILTCDDATLAYSRALINALTEDSAVVSNQLPQQLRLALQDLHHELTQAESTPSCSMQA